MSDAIEDTVEGKTKELIITISNDKFLASKAGVRDYSGLPRVDRERIRKYAGRVVRGEISLGDY